MSDVYTSGDIVSAIMTGDNSRSKEGIFSVLGQKSMDELEVRKAEIAQNMFNDAPVDEIQADNNQDDIPEVDPRNGEDIENSEVSAHAPDNPEIAVVDPHTGQPTETLSEPNSASA